MPHYLKRTGKGKLWDMVCGVGWDRRLHLVPSSSATYDVTFGEVSFAASIFRLDGRRSLSISQAGAERTFLESLCDFARGKGRFLAVADDARLLFDASQSWRYLEHIVRKYDIPVQPRPPQAFGKRGTSASAFILPESRPFVVSLKIPAENIDLTLCCLSSFGARRIDDTRDLADAWCIRGGLVPIDSLEAYSISMPEAVRACEHVLALQSTTVKLGCVSVGVTAGGTASTLFRACHLSDNILCLGDSDENRFARLCYHGGRAEAYRLGTIERSAELLADELAWSKQDGTLKSSGHVVHLDFASMYPAIYTACRLPVRYSHTTAHISMDDAEAMQSEYCGFVHARVKTDVPCVPMRVARGVNGSIHPIKPIETYRDLGRGSYTIYPVGVFDVFVPFPELRRLRKLGGAYHIHRADWYHSGNPLKEYGETLQAVRDAAKRNGDIATVAAVKLLMNSITGKLAPREKRWVEVEPAADADGWECWQKWNRETLTLDTYRNILGKTYVLETGGESESSCPFLPAYITSLARVLLDRAIEAAGRESVFYTDTDSIFTTQAGADRLRTAGYVVDGVPGKMRVVGEYYRLEIVGFKAYRADGKLVLSGITDKYTEVARDIVEVESDKIEARLPGDDTNASKRLSFFRSNARRPYVHGEVGGKGKISPWRINMIDPENIGR